MNNPYQGKPEYYDPGPYFMACPLCSQSKDGKFSYDAECDLCEGGFVECHPDSTPEEIIAEYTERKASEILRGESA